MVVIPGGSFDMGSNAYGPEKPIRRVKVKSFALAKTPVTQGQWRAVMGNNPSCFQDGGDNCPVENVSWDDAQDYLKKLSAKTGKTYRLPTEAEWEYACRAGGNIDTAAATTLTRWHGTRATAAAGFMMWPAFRKMPSACTT
jgi:formylglycine-generating enzyme required for sulfatase activity